jgi:tetratricopeptide (TPR) repeat protein
MMRRLLRLPAAGWPAGRTPLVGGRRGQVVLDRFLLGAGIAFIAAAIVAGGFKGLGVEVPVVNSLARQVLLAGFGLGLMVLSLLVRTRGDDAIPTAAAAAAAVLPAVPVPGAVPRATRYFVGRGRQLVELHQMLTAEGLAVLTGLGGVGKTQLALAHLRLHREDVDLVWWLRAGSALTLAEDYAALADARRLTDPAAALAEKVAAARRWLEASSRWLLVFDNAADAKTVTDYLPSEQGGRVIITSRDRLWPEAAMLEVEPWARAEAVTFLEDHTKSDPRTAAELAEVLGNLPLALEQARAYLEVTRQPATTYLAELRQELQQRMAGLLGEGTPAHYQATVATTWALSIAQVRREAPGAAELLSLLAFLSPEAVPRSLPGDHPGQLPKELRRVAGDRRAYEQAMAALGRFSLVAVTEDILTVHRLVQAVVRQSLDTRTARRWAGATVRLLWAAFPSGFEDVDAWPVCALLLPHALAAADYAEKLDTDLEATAGLLTKSGRYLWGRAELGQARRLFERALAMRQTRLGSDHLHVAESLYNLGAVLTELGDPAAARTHLERALAIRQARLGPEDPHVAQSLDSLGIVLAAVGDLTTARDHFEHALAIREARLGPDHPDVAASHSNLGFALQQLGDLTTARDHFERALAIDENRFSRNHPRVAGSLSNLGNVLGDLGEPAAARTHLEDALTIQQTRLNPNHLHVAESLNNLGAMLEKVGELAAARDHYRRALAIYEVRLGPNHVDTAKARASLDAVVAALGEHAADRADDN